MERLFCGNWEALCASRTARSLSWNNKMIKLARHRTAAMQFAPMKLYTRGAERERALVRLVLTFAQKRLLLGTVRAFEWTVRAYTLSSLWACKFRADSLRWKIQKIALLELRGKLRWRENEKQNRRAVSSQKLKLLVQFHGNFNWKAITSCSSCSFEAEVHSSSLNRIAFPFRFLFTLGSGYLFLLFPLVLLFDVKIRGAFWTEASWNNSLVYSLRFGHGKQPLKFKMYLNLARSMSKDFK